MGIEMISSLYSFEIQSMQVAQHKVFNPINKLSRHCMYECFIFQAGGGYCGNDAYFDGVLDKCVHCGEICNGDVYTEFCVINCPGGLQ